MATETEARKIADCVKAEWNPNFTREKVTLKAGTTQSVKVGSPLRDDTGMILVANGSESLVTHIALENIEATGGEKIVALRNGPALVNPAEMTFATDVTFAELSAYLIARDIREISEPAEIEVGLATGL